MYVPKSGLVSVLDRGLVGVGLDGPSPDGSVSSGSEGNMASVSILENKV